MTIANDHHLIKELREALHASQHDLGKVRKALKLPDDTTIAEILSRIYYLRDGGWS